jgi:hypothetical protein
MILHRHIFLPSGLPKITNMAMGIDIYIFSPRLWFFAFTERMSPAFWKCDWPPHDAHPPAVL